MQDNQIYSYLTTLKEFGEKIDQTITKDTEKN